MVNLPILGQTYQNLRPMQRFLRLMVSFTITCHKQSSQERFLVKIDKSCNLYLVDFISPQSLTTFGQKPIKN